MIEKAEKKKLIEKWKYTYDHYTKQECPPDCPCRSSTFDDDEPNFFFGNDFEDNSSFGVLPDEIVSQILMYVINPHGKVNTTQFRQLFFLSKRFITLLKDPIFEYARKFIVKPVNRIIEDLEKQQKLKKIIESIEQSVSTFCHGTHTAHLESYHSYRTHFAPKGRSWWGSWRARSFFSVIAHNNSLPEAIKMLYNKLEIQISKEEYEKMESLIPEHIPETKATKSLQLEKLRRKQAIQRQEQVEQKKRNLETYQSSNIFQEEH